MKYLFLPLILLGLSVAGSGQSLSDSAEFRQVFRQLLASRPEKFRPLMKDSTGLFLRVELPGPDIDEVSRTYDSDDSSFVYEAVFYSYKSEQEARDGFRQLLALVRHALKPQVMKEQRTTSPSGEICYFFQTDTAFYYDSYLEVEYEKYQSDKEWKVHLRLFARPARLLYYVNKGHLIKDEAYKRFLQKTELATFAAFKQLRGRKLEGDLYALRDSIPGYNGRMYETSGGTVAELVSGFRSDDPEKSRQFFYELVGRIKYGLPANYVVYENPEAAANEALEQVIFHKAYTEVNTFPAYPRLSYTLTRSGEDPTVYNVWLRVIRYE